MPLKVVVELQIHAVTCPGVFLPDKDDIFLSTSLLGQCKETRCLPAVFPLLFHEKMRFEKVFQKQVDPAAVVEILEKYPAGFELMQVGQSEEILATYKENHRGFLFPEPKLTPPYPGVDREVLMKTVCGFPGIAPKIEFSTRTTIKEKPKDFQKKNSSNKIQCRRSLPNSPTRKSRMPTKSYSSPEQSYSSPTGSSKSRSPSPYARRRMCELNKDSQQRLSHLKLGNYEFKSDADTKPPFIVRHVDSFKPVGEKTASQLQSPKAKHHSSSENRLRRALTFDNLNCTTSTEKDHLDLDDLHMPRKANSSVDKGTLSDSLSSSTCSLQDLRTSPVLKGSLRERCRSDNNTWEAIHNRVRNLLSTHRARQLLSLDISNSEADRILERSSRKKSLNGSSEGKIF
ncbi:PREDICTED: spermatogenesis associated 6-like protein [Nanorana parkeri]|uniref:spermatogenesis associated 6-like protein n=1 Tax=Nanorana parkeri TaxID=125878 RepID=UPI0008548CDB|nr:PREDICTED: spermatogenesis associated 6-like protein [Nanorana parkeri]